MNGIKIEDGIHIIGKKCACGDDIRLHAHVFTTDDGPVQRYYLDCRGCGKVTGWYDTPEEVAKAFDAGVEPEYQTRTEDVA